jgi:hypothetical protein
MTVGTAIVVVMLLYLLDKHGLLKRAAVVVAVLAAVALCWIYAAKWYKGYSYRQEQKQLHETEAALISKYKDALPDLPVLSPDEVEEEVPSDTVPAAPAKPLVFIGDICKEQSFRALDDWEKQEVLEAIKKPEGDGFARLDFLAKCKIR